MSFVFDCARNISEESPVSASLRGPTHSDICLLVGDMAKEGLQVSGAGQRVEEGIC